MKNLILLLLVAMTGSTAFAQAPPISWAKCYGGTETDIGYGLCLTTDGGYCISGSTESTDGDITSYKGHSDVWVLRLNANGTIKWQKNIGGSNFDDSWAIANTMDGGFFVFGHNGSPNGDIPNYKGGLDAAIIKLDSLGNIVWIKSYGGSGLDFSRSMSATADGGCIFISETNSSDYDVTANYGNTDIWVVKLDASGNIQWKQNYGGSNDEQPWCIRPTADGGYIFTGQSRSTDGNLTANKGQADVWVVKITSAGSITWQKNLGGTDIDMGEWIEQTVDGGYILTATTYSTDGDVTGNHGNTDMWLVKLDASGNITWQKTYGGTDADEHAKAKPLAAGGYIMAGNVKSTNGDITDHKGIYDVWLTRLNDTGAIVWKKSYGGVQWDIAEQFSATPDFGYVLSVKTTSNDGDVSGSHGGPNKYDMWIVKLGTDSTAIVPNAVAPVEKNNIKVWPTATDGVVSIQLTDELANAVIQLTDMMGRVLVTNNEKGITRHVDISNFPSGTYLLQVTGKEKRSVFRVSRL